MLGEIAVVDEGIGPQGINQFFTRDELLGASGEVDEEVEGAWIERHRLADPSEEAGPEVQLEIVEMDESAQFQGVRGLEKN